MKDIVAKKAPQLRFPEFSGEWEVKMLGNLLKIGSGRDYKHLGKGDIPVYGTGGLMLHVNDYLYDGKSICIGRKGTIDHPQFLNGKFWTVDTLFYTYDYKNSVPEFIYPIFQKINWQKWNEASGVPSLSKTTIESIKVNVPKEPEQQKIAGFLTVVDEQVAAMSKKVELLQQYKKGVMQKIFSQKLRFKDENSNDYPDWQEKKLGEVFDEVLTRIGDRKLETYSITAGVGFVSQAKKFGKDISGAQNERYTLLSIGEFAYNKGNSKTYTYGCVYENKEGKPIAIPNVFISFKLKDNRMSNGFFGQLFVNHYLDRHLRRIISSGARMDGLLNVNKGSFFEIHIPIPCSQEQQQIADFLTSLDDKINLEKNKLEQAKLFKKSLLQRMFVS